MDWQAWIIETRALCQSLQSNPDYDELDDMYSHIETWIENKQNIPADMVETVKWVVTDAARYYRTACEELAKGPGKFEGEPAYIIPFWNGLMNGFDDGDGNFDITETDKYIWEDLRDYTTANVSEDDNGFAHIELMQIFPLDSKQQI
jgi:hypothetical protein